MCVYLSKREPSVDGDGRLIRLWRSWMWTTPMNRGRERELLLFGYTHTTCKRIYSRPRLIFYLKKKTHTRKGIKGERHLGNVKTKPGRGGNQILCFVLFWACPTTRNNTNGTLFFFLSNNWNRQTTKPERFFFFSFQGIYLFFFIFFFWLKTYRCRWNHRLRSPGNRYRWNCPKCWYTGRKRHKVDICTRFRL